MSPSLPRRRARLASIAAALAVTASLAAVTTLDSGASAASTTPVARSAGSSAVAPYVPPAIDWGKCTTSDTLKSTKGAQCGTLVVPMDYANPTGTKIRLAVSRILHTGSKDLGPMFTNPGGPGGAGLVYSILGGFIPNGVGNMYDWYGMDPRGVGTSKPALTCDGSYFSYARPSYIPTTSKAEKQWRAKALGYEKDCASQKAKALLAHMHTTDNVQDFESLRTAIGAERISFYGFSYGTYIEQVYATLYPQRIKRMVMDGVLNGNRPSYYTNIDQDRAFEKSENIFFGWMAKHDRVFHVGRTQKAVRAAYDRQVLKLRAHPAGGKLGSSELADAMLGAGYYVYGWVDTAKAFAALVNKGQWRPLAAMYRSSNPVGKGADNGYDVYLATQCTDSPWPTKYSTWKKDQTRVDKQAPFYTWANAWFNMPCKDWPVAPATPVRVDGSGLSGKVLMIEETYDAATPFAGALAMRKAFPSASMIEGVGGTTHAGSLSGVSCTDNTIATYLKTGKVPARKAGNRSDKKCNPVPRPDPTAKGRVSARESARMMERRALLPALRW